MESVEARTVPESPAIPRPRSFSPTRALSKALARCGPFEWLTLSYIGFLTSLLLTFGHNLANAPKYLALHLGIASGILLLVRAAAEWPHPALRFARHWYPLLMFLFFFEELHYLVHIVFPQWFDAWLIQADFAVFGFHPTVWLEQFSSPVLNDAMQFAYMIYYFYTLVLCGLLLGKGEESAFWRVMSATALAYYIGYAVSILFPIEGPFHTLAAFQRGELPGGVFTALMNFVEGYGRVHGAAFPSAHVSGATVAVLGAWRFRRRLFWGFLPLYLAMLVSTVYGRYHYAADVLGGLLVGWFAFRVMTGSRWDAYFATAVRDSKMRRASVA